jgi:hypothetical protein
MYYCTSIYCVHKLNGLSVSRDWGLGIGGKGYCKHARSALSPIIHDTGGGGTWKYCTDNIYVTQTPMHKLQCTNTTWINE